MTNSKTISVRAFRCDPSTDSGSRFLTYEIPSAEPLSVMVLMRKIHEMDPTFACRTSMCFKGACGGCLVRVDGRRLLGCSTLIEPGATITLEPHDGFRLIRDVVVDFESPLQPQQELPE